MKRKRESNRRGETLNQCQLELAGIASKLRSLGSLMANLDQDADLSLDGIGLLLSELSAQVEGITDRIDPANLKLG